MIYAQIDRLFEKDMFLFFVNRNLSISSTELNNHLHAFFICKTFVSNGRIKLAKNQVNAKQHTEAELLLFEYYSHFSSTRSNHQRCSIQIGVLRNFTKFTGKHLCQSLFFNKVTGPRPATLLKKRLWHKCFPVKFTKFLRTPFLQSSSWRLLLKMILKQSSWR